MTDRQDEQLAKKPRVDSGGPSSQNDAPTPEIDIEIIASAHPHLKPSRIRELSHTASLLATPGKGITACDESAGTVGKRFADVGIANTEENRRAYRQMLFEAEGAQNYLCGAILDVETLYQVREDN